jgi:hypothetical protein
MRSEDYRSRLITHIITGRLVLGQSRGMASFVCSSSRYHRNDMASLIYCTYSIEASMRELFEGVGFKVMA